MAAKKDYYIHNGMNAAQALIATGRMQSEGYPVNIYTMSGSWQAKAWRQGFDKARSEQK